MRLFRTCAQPANITLSCHFQRHQVFEITHDLLHAAPMETSNLKHGSNVQCLARSYAASASSDRLQTKYPRKKIPKDKRKSMVENFVNRYREMNEGKFPTPVKAMKDVGGSYYVVRGILQEVIYESKMPPIDKKEASPQKIAIEKGEKIESSNPIDEPKNQLHLDSENRKTIHEDEQKFDGPKSKTEFQESKEVSERELHKAPTEVAESKTQTSLWQNLKSFANGIFGRWKRS